MIRTIITVFLLCSFLVACDSASDYRLERLDRTEFRVQAADVSQDGRFSAVLTSQEGIKLFDNKKGNMLHHWQQEQNESEYFFTLAFSPSADVLLAASRMTLVLWDTESGAVIGAWRNDESSIIDIAVANGGHSIALARNDGKVIYFEPKTQRRLELLQHQDKVTQVELSANGQFLLSGGNDHQAILWQLEPVTILHRFQASGRITQLALDATGHYALVSSSREAIIYHLVTGEPIQQLRPFKRSHVFSSARFSSDQQWLITGTASRLVELWSIQSGKRACSWHIQGRKHDSPPQAALLSFGFQQPAQFLVETSAGFAESWRLPASCLAALPP